MASSISFDSIEIGTELPPNDFVIQRSYLIQYCGASGDFNIIHWNERIATAVGLPNVISHGMFTMAEAGRVLTDWVGDPGAILDYSVRFSRPVVVPDDDIGALLSVGGVVTEKLEGNRVRVELTARVGESKVLLAARAVIQLA